jgi:S1-C subfamily serine protease
MNVQPPNAIASALMALAIVATLGVPVDAVLAADAPTPDTETREQLDQKLREAQERLEEAAEEVAELSVSISDEVGPEVRRFAHQGSRPMLGIGIDMDDKGAAPDGHGVRVTSVSPGGPADVAGIKANDVIVAFAGKPLAGADGKSPQKQLLAGIRDAKAGQSLVIEYQRDGKLTKTQIVPKSVADSLADLRMFSMDDMPAPPDPDTRHGARLRPMPFGMHDDQGFGSAELVELSPQLGKYFGVDKGLLVVRAPHDERFKLQDGDVILDIDGRTPSGVSHAFQILSSYRSGETVKLHVMRQQKRVELPVQVPESSSLSPSRLPPAPPPAPGVLPAAPTPPPAA